MTGEIALVCGATGTIGSAVARRLARDGARVAVHARSSAERARALADEVAAPAHPFLADITDRAAVDGLFGAIEETLGGPPTIVVNAAYPAAPDGRVEDATADDARAHFAGFLMNLEVCRRALRGMTAAGRGRIVVISAALAQRVFPGLSLYAATAAALNTFARTLALEAGPAGITVNVVAPGRIEGGDDVEPYARLADISRLRAALPAFASPDDVAAAVAYLASPDAGAVTGQTIQLAAGEPL